jgi:tape measure domain-containing protein
MATTLGTLILRLKADRLQLKTDLQQAEDMVQSYSAKFRQAVNGALSLKLNLDESTLSGAFARIQQRQANLVGLLAKPLKIQVDDQRLTDLNEHFRLKERDYEHLQQVLNAPLVVRVDDRQINSLQRKLADLGELPSINLRAQVDQRALENFHAQLTQYTQSRTVALATSVSGASLVRLQSDLKALATGLTTARVAVQVDSQLDALRSQMGSLRSLNIKAHVDSVELRKLNQLLGHREIKLTSKFEGSGDLSRTIEHATKAGLTKGMSGNALKSALAPVGAVLRGAFEGLGKELFGGISRSFSGTVNKALGNTIGSPELVGRRLAETGIQKIQVVSNQLGAENPGTRNTIVAIQQAIRETLGEREVAIAANKTRGMEQRREQADLKMAQGGVLGEFRAAAKEKEAATFDAVAAYRSTRSEQAKIDELDTPFQAKLADIARRKAQAQSKFVKAQEKELAALEQQLAEASSPETQQVIGQRMRQVADRKFSGSQYDNEARIVEGQRRPIQARQDAIDNILEPAAARVQVAEDRHANAFKQANLLKRKQQPKIVQDILDDISPNLPEHMVPELVSDPELLGSRTAASYSPAHNRVRLNPMAYRQMMAGGRLDEETYKSVREEYEHAKDFQFGSFEGYQARGEFRIPGNKREKASPQEEAAIAQELEQYDPKVRHIERNAKIRRDRAYKQYSLEQDRQQLETTVGLGGRQFEASYSPQGVATNVASLSSAAQRRGVNFPSLAKLETKSQQLQVEHQRLIEQIHLGLSGKLNSEQLAKLTQDLDAQTKAVITTKQRIAGAQKGLIKTVEAGGAGYQPPGAEPIAKASVASKIVAAGKSMFSTTISPLDSTHEPGRVGQAIGHGVDALRGGYSFLQGAENVALGLIPGGKTAKGVIQHTALPAAAFHVAANALPGGQVLSHGLQSGLHALMGIPGAGLGAAAHGLVETTLGQLPVMGGGLSTATSALTSGAIDMATSAGASVLAPILGGKAIFNAGQQAINMLPSKNPEHHQMLAAGETVGRVLASAAPATKQLVQQGRNTLNAAGAKLISQSVEPLETFALPAASQRALPPPPRPQLGSTKPEGYNPRSVAEVELAPIGVQIAGNIRSGTAGATDAVKRAKEIRDKFNQGFKSVQQAIKAGDADRAAQYAEMLNNTLNRAEQEIRELTQSLGPAGKGTKAASQLGQSKSQLSQVRNKLQRLRDTGKIAVAPRSIEQQLAEEELANLTPEQVRAIPANELYANPTQEFPTGFSAPARARNRRQLKRRLIESRREVGNYEQTMLPDEYARSQAQAAGGRAASAIQPPSKPAIQLPSTFDPNNPDPAWPTNFFSPTAQQPPITSAPSSVGAQPPSWIQRLKQQAQALIPRRAGNLNAIDNGLRAVMSAEKNLGKFERAEANIQAKEAKNLGDMAVGASGGGSDGILSRVFRILRAETGEAKAGLAGLAGVAGNVLKTFGGFALAAGAVALISKIGASSVEAAIKMEGLTNSIRSVASSRAEADKVIADTRKRSDYLGQNNVSNLEASRAFMAATKGTNLELISGDVLKGFGQLAASDRASPESTKNAMLALQQMATKGEELSTEEVRQQLSEASPSAVGALARGSGMNVTQFYRAINEKTISTTSALSRGAQQAQAESAGGADLASKSTEASLGRLGNATTELNVAVGNNFLGGAKLGMDAATTAAKLLAENIDTLGKLFLAAILASASAAVTLSGGLSLASPLVGTLAKGLIVAAPALATFAIQAAIAYAALEVLNTVIHGLSDNSPGKEFADQMVANLERIEGKSADVKKALADMDDEKYGKGRNPFERAGDAIIGGLRQVGIGGLTTTVEKVKADSIVNVDRGLTATQKLIDRKEDPQATQVRLNKVGAIDNELSVIRAETARLTSADGAKLAANEKRTQELVKQKSELEAPRADRSGRLETAAKQYRDQIKDETLPEALRESAKRQLALIETEQRQLSQQFSTVARDMTENLRRLSTAFVTANQAIEREATLSRTANSYSAAANPLNVGAGIRAAYRTDLTEQTGKAGAAQRAVGQIEQTLNTGQNQKILQTLKINPKNFSQDDLDNVSKNFQDDQGKALIGYLGKYKEALTQLDKSNEQVGSTQANYAKALADYNKAYAEKLASLQARYVSLLLSARSKLDQVQASIAETSLDIDRTGAANLAKKQKNQLQAAYNKFLGKLGMATDSLFDTIFEGFDSVLSIFEEFKSIGFDQRAGSLKTKARKNQNETTYAETYYQEKQSNEAARRELLDTQRANPANQYGGGPTVGTGNFRVSSPVPGLSLQEAINYQGLPVQRPDANRPGRPRGHDAIDYGTQAGVKLGTPVLAAYDGTATYTPGVTYYKGKYRTNQATLSGRAPNGDRLNSKYFHLGDSSEYFKDAERLPNGSYVKRVRAGEPIGRVGADGEIGGNEVHLDFTTYINGRKVKDPREFLRYLMQQAVQDSQGAGSGAIKITTGEAKTKDADAGEKGYKSTTRPVSGARNNWNNVTTEDSDSRYRQVPSTESQIDRLRANPIPTVRPRKVRSTPRAIEQPRTIPPSSSNSPAQATAPSQSGGYTDVVSSWYTPGEGGAINGGRTDIRDKYIDRNSLVMATRTTDSPGGIPYGARVEVRDPRSGRTVIVENRDRGTLRPGRDIDLTPAAAKRLGVTPDGVTKLQMRVLSVPKGQVAPSYNLGGGIGRYDNKGNYTGAAGTTVRTGGTGPTTDTPRQGAPNSYTGEDIANAGRSQAGQISAQEKLSADYLEKLRIGLELDTATAQRQQQANYNLGDTNRSGLRTRATGQSIRLRNKLELETYNQNNRTRALNSEATAINSSRDRSAYQPIEQTYQSVGGIADRSTVDPTVTEAQSTTDRIVNDRRERGQNLLNQIKAIEAAGAGWAETKKGILAAIEQAKKEGDNFQAELLTAMVRDTDAAIGSPEARQRTISALSANFKKLPSLGVTGYDAVAPGVKPALAATQDLSAQYLPNTYDNRLQAQARAVIDRFAAVKTQVLSELKKLDTVISTLEQEIQSKLAAAGYGPQKLDLNDPARRALLTKVAPEETAALTGATRDRADLSRTSTRLDTNARQAADRSITIARVRDSIATERVSNEYYSQTQQGNLYTTRQLDANKFALGKRELELDFKDGTISAEMYSEKLRMLSLETNTLRNAMLPLREASNNFFQDIFKSKDILTGLGDAFRGLVVSILTQIQTLISQHLGQQLFGSLLGGAGDAANDKSGAGKYSITNALKTGLGFLGLGETRDQPNDFTPPKIESPISRLAAFGHEALGRGDTAGDRPKSSAGNAFSGGGLAGVALNILSGAFLPAFADGGMVTSPTVALVGEGIHNEAIVPLPNGRSIPVDLKNAGGGGGTTNNSSVAVTINNQGAGQEVSRGDATAFAGHLKGIVYETILAESRPGGLLNRG